jgi:hypothetical protein
MSETIEQQIARVTSFEDCIVCECCLIDGHAGPHRTAEEDDAEWSYVEMSDGTLRRVHVNSGLSY